MSEERRMVTTNEELDALPGGSVVLEVASGDSAQKNHEGYWYLWGGDVALDAADMESPRPCSMGAHAMKHHVTTFVRGVSDPQGLRKGYAASCTCGAVTFGGFWTEVGARDALEHEEGEA